MPLYPRVVVDPSHCEGWNNMANLLQRLYRLTGSRALHFVVLALVFSQDPWCL
jgi:hypothetical protein